MNEKSSNNQNVAAAPVAKSTLTCDLHNPTRAIRVIYDGIEGSQKCITITPGDTKRVTLHRSVVEELAARNKAKKNGDLVVREPAAA